MKFLSLREIKTLLKEFNIEPSKSLGQNFLFDHNTLRQIVRLSNLGGESCVLEIGAGLGNLTLALADIGLNVIAIEKDKKVFQALKSVILERNLANQVKAFNSDALECDLDALDACQTNSYPSVLVANLPYNCASQLVLKVLSQMPKIKKLVFLIQKELGQKMLAHAGESSYGALSVKIAYFANGRLLKHVGSNVFIPRPKVTSVLLELNRLTNSYDIDYQYFSQVVNYAFNKRRKMLKSSFREALDVLSSFGISPMRRPEEIDIDSWVRISKEFKSRNLSYII